MVCVKRKIRAKVVFFRELSENYAKKAVESVCFVWLLVRQWLKSPSEIFRFYAINTLYCIKKYIFYAIGCIN